MRRLGCVLMAAVVVFLGACTKPSAPPPAPTPSLQGGLRLDVPDGAITGGGSVDVSYPATSAWAGHKALSPAVELSTTGQIVHAPTLTFPVPDSGRADAADGLVEVAYRTGDGAWTTVPSTYDAAAHTVSVSLPHFSTWQLWGWDWVDIGADINQEIGAWTGHRADGPAKCPDAAKKHPTPSWVNLTAGIENGPALVVRGCTQGHQGDDTLDVELVNNRPYGLLLSYQGAKVAWGRHAVPSTLVDGLRDVIGEVQAGSKGLYLPPLSTASVGIAKPGSGKHLVFPAVPTPSTITADVWSVIASKVLQVPLDAVGKKWLADVFARSAAGSCSQLGVGFSLVKIPGKSTIADIVKSSGPECIKDILIVAARAEVAKGAGMDLATIGRLTSGIKAVSHLIDSGQLELADIGAKVADFTADGVYAKVEGLGFGFSVLSRRTPSSEGIALTSRQVGPVSMGTGEKAAVAAITALLGAPTLTGTIGPGCEIAPDGSYHQLVVWDALVLEFTGKAADGHDMALHGWTARPGPARTPLVLPHDVTLKRTRGVDLLKQVPDADVQAGPGTSAESILVDKDGVYFGLDGKNMDAVVGAAGFPLALCD